MSKAALAVRAAAVVVVTVGLGLLASSAHAQPVRYVDDPTAGLALPTIPIAGDASALDVTLNPASLVFLDDFHLDAAYTGRNEDEIASLGAGAGLYVAHPLDLPLLPRLAFGAAVEQLLPPRIVLAPDPGEPVRLTLAAAWATSWLGGRLGIGANWHHFFDRGGGTLDDLDTFDAGLSFRGGATWAAGLVVRDLFEPEVDGVPVQRRWDLELDLRPLGDDRLELGIGGELGERRLDGSGRLRASVRLARGVYLDAEGQLAALLRLEDPAFPTGQTDTDLGWLGTLGLRVSFGGVGAAAYASLGGAEGGSRSFGGTGIVRWSDERYPSVIPRKARIERIKLQGAYTQRELTRTLLYMRRLERDRSVKAVFVSIDGVDVGWADIQDLRGGLARLRKAKKTVFAYMVAGNTRDYYLAAAADKIYLDAAGGLRVQGLASTSLFFKQLFDNIGVLAQFEKIEEFKSAPESFTRTDSSEPAKQMREELIGDIYDRIATDVAADRGKTPAAVRAFMENGPYTAVEAGEAGGVDAVVEPATVDTLVAKELGRSYRITDGTPVERSTSWELPQVAVIYIDGDIIDGKSQTIPLLGEKLVGGETIAQALIWARGNSRIKAVVLRIDSPGGSALASEVMAREVFKTRGVKPILVSMGAIAASGGYFAAAGGETIYAQPSTLTGSIGIFTGKFDLSTLLLRIGITWETVRRGDHADLESMYRPYTDEERKLIKEKLRYYYGRFVKAVMQGRGMTFDEVDAVGRGHVWSGERAKEKKLVDQYGSVADAIIEAKKRAGYGETTPVEVVMLPAEPSSVLSQLLKLAGGRAENQAEIAPLAAFLKAFPASLLFGPDVPQARMDINIVIE